MNVPRHIGPAGPLGSDDDGNNYIVPSSNATGHDFNGIDGHARDRMIVPDRIIVAGGDETMADKAPPREMTLDMHAFVHPARYGQTGSLLETPPDRLTLHNRAFPTPVDEMEFYRQQQQQQYQHQLQQQQQNRQSQRGGAGMLEDSYSKSPNSKRGQQSFESTQKLDSMLGDEEKTFMSQMSHKEINRSESVMSAASMSVLSPAEELVLLRNQVRKLTTRLQKLEEEVQDTSRHVSWIEVFGAVIVSILVMKSIANRM